MNIFVTGATGFVGSAVVKELLQAGHHVTGLARSNAAAMALKAVGAQAHPGHLEDVESLRQGAKTSDGVIHLGFIHDFSKFNENCGIDRRAIETIGSALAGSDRPFLITSGTALVARGVLATEDLVAEAGPHAIPRVASELAAQAMAETRIRVGIVRLPPSVHGEGDHGFVPMVIAMSREKKASAYIGDGQNRWPSVHRTDAASLYRLAFENAPKALSRWHAVADSGVPFRDIAHVIGQHLHVPVVSKSSDEAPAHFAWFTHFAALDNPASSAKTREALGWTPTQPGLLADLDHEYYFKA